MYCLLFRHGIAASTEEWNGSKEERPPTKEGITKTEQAVEGLKQFVLGPTHLLCGR